jgi:hypothetical protein
VHQVLLPHEQSYRVPELAAQIQTFQAEVEGRGLQVRSQTSM